MRIQPGGIKIPEDDPFSNDLLDRKKHVEVLTRLIDSIEGPCVLAIDAEWGFGKTTFLEMWHQSLRKQDYPVVSFNAWENDHVSDPLAAISNELTEELNKLTDKKIQASIKKTNETCQTISWIRSQSWFVTRSSYRWDQQSSNSIVGRVHEQQGRGQDIQEYAKRLGESCIRIKRTSASSHHDR